MLTLPEDYEDPILSFLANELENDAESQTSTRYNSWDTATWCRFLSFLRCKALHALARRLFAHIEHHVFIDFSSMAELAHVHYTDLIGSDDVYEDRLFELARAPEDVVTMFLYHAETCMRHSREIGSKFRRAGLTLDHWRTALTNADVDFNAARIIARCWEETDATCDDWGAMLEILTGDGEHEHILREFAIRKLLERNREELPFD